MSFRVCDIRRTTKTIDSDGGVARHVASLWCHNETEASKLGARHTPAHTGILNAHNNRVDAERSPGKERTAMESMDGSNIPRRGGHLTEYFWISCQRIFFCRRCKTYTNASAGGGQPGTQKSTGMTLSHPRRTA